MEDSSMPNFAKIGASRSCGAKNLILGPLIIAIPPLALRAGGTNY